MPTLTLAGMGLTDVGRRPNNEDAYFVGPRLAVVADGVGGAAAGEIASRAVVNALVALDKRWVDEPLDTALAGAIADGNAALALIATQDPSLAGMSTTVTAVALDDGGRYVIAHVGDSRAYLLRDEQLAQLTVDESLVQRLVDDGLLDARDVSGHPQRSVLLRALDGGADDRPVLEVIEARAGDRLLVCSDGLSDALRRDAIRGALMRPCREDAAGDLVRAALDAGGRDNVTVVVADVVVRPGAAGWRRPAHSC